MAKPTKFTDEAKAYKYAAGQNAIAPDKFCPLLRDKCRADCHCWQKAYVKKNTAFDSAIRSSGEVWWVYAPCCENAMFSGGRFEL